jgi:hypothetical protein
MLVWRVRFHPLVYLGFIFISLIIFCNVFYITNVGSMIAERDRKARKR